MRWMAIACLSLGLLSAAPTAKADDKIACREWCNKCMSGGAACAANCAQRNQPRVNPSCEVRYNPQANATTQLLSGKSGETIPLGSVYWIANCKSILKSFAGVDVLDGPSGIALSLKPGKVHATRQNCSKPVEGATVMMTVKNITQEVNATLKYRVRYITLDGEKQSSHAVRLDLFP